MAESWAKVEELGAEEVGVLIFKNIFALAPEALQLFSFKNEPDLHRSEKLRRHGAKVVTTDSKGVTLISFEPCSLARPPGVQKFLQVFLGDLRSSRALGRCRESCFRTPQQEGTLENRR